VQKEISTSVKKDLNRNDKKICNNFGVGQLQSGAIKGPIAAIIGCRDITRCTKREFKRHIRCSERRNKTRKDPLRQNRERALTTAGAGGCCGAGGRHDRPLLGWSRLCLLWIRNHVVRIPRAIKRWIFSHISPSFPSNDAAFLLMGRFKIAQLKVLEKSLN